MSTARTGRWPDELTRQQVKSRLKENLYLEAGAGTGKTNALVTKLSELLITRTAEPTEIAAITFTRAAAFEMRSRLRAALEERASQEQDPDSKARIATAVDSLDTVAIQTIHSFALSMLREEPLEIGLPPVIEPLDDIQASVEFDARWSNWLTERIESHDDHAPALGIAQRLGIRNPIDLLRQLARRLGEMHQHLQPGMFSYGGPKPPPVSTSHLAETIAQAREIVANAPDPEDTMCRFVNDQVTPEVISMLSLADDSPHLAASDFADWPPFKPRNKGSKTKWARATGGEIALERLRNLLADLQAEIERSLSVLRRQTLGTLLTAATDFALDYAHTRQVQGRLTFHDQLVLANRLLQNSTGARQRLRARFKFILVDEFQDTDPLQIDLLRLLAGDENGGLRPGSLFIVGDPKQSIYRFRGADPASSSGFSAQVTNSGDTLPLSENHRSLPGVLKWVNTVFSGWMKEGEVAGQAPHRDLRWDMELEQKESELTGPPVWWFGGERETGASDTRKREFEDISAITVAAGEGAFRVRSKTGEWRDSTFADVAVLMRGRTGIDVLEDALIEKNVPYVFDSQAPLFTSQDIRDLHANLTAIDDPSDQVACLSAIRSPAFSCPDTDLLLWKQAHGTFSYLDTNQPDAPESVTTAFAELHRYHRLSREQNTATVVEAFIRERRLREKSMLTRLGPERARRLDLIVELAYSLSDPATASSITLRDFTRWLARQSEENAQMPERISQGSTGNVVRVMTIHGAKGLEFPIVIMASAQGGQGSNDSVQLRLLRQDGNPGDGARQLEVQLGNKDVGLRTAGADEAVEQEAEEGELEDVRLLYVAATRARDHLLVSRYRGKRAKNALIGKIEQHLKGNEILWQEWSYPGRASATPVTIAPTPDSKADREHWAAERNTLLVGASRPRYTTPTALKSEKSTFLPQPKEASETLGEESAKPGRGATDLGRAVHAVLQHIGLVDWSETDLRTLSERMANEHGNQDPGEVARLAKAALQTETMTQAANAARRGEAWREVSIAAPLPGQVGELEGQIDLMFLNADGTVTVVDHKTDRVRGDNLELAAAPYLPQMGAYAWCVEAVTGMTVSRAVLVFARRAETSSLGEFTVPDLPAEKLRASQLAVEKVSASMDDG